MVLKRLRGLLTVLRDEVDAEHAGEDEAVAEDEFALLVALDDLAIGHLAADGLVLYRNIFGICQQVAGQRCTLYGFRLATVARCAGAFATTHYCISFYQIQLSATLRFHTVQRKFSAFCRFTFCFPFYPV